MTKAETRALLAVWDRGQGTRAQLGLTPYMAKHLVSTGHLLAKSRSISVGKGKTIYSLSELGVMEILLTSKRFASTVAK